jgi:hemolysin III
MTRKLREPINAITHLSGAVFFFLGTIVMLAYQLVHESSLLKVTGGLVFGTSLVLLYLASGIYHSYDGREQVIKVLKKLDHSMIYVLIAGSYTPMCLQVLDGSKRIVILTIIWGIVIVGVLTKVFVQGIPRPVYTLFYLLMGWMVVFFIKDVYEGLPLGGFSLLALGGVLYTTGGIIYMVKKPNLGLEFGFHELFHVFILAGSFSHYLMIFLYLS